MTKTQPAPSNDGNNERELGSIKKKTARLIKANQNS